MYTENEGFSFIIAFNYRDVMSLFVGLQRYLIKYKRDASSLYNCGQSSHQFCYGGYPLLQSGATELELNCYTLGTPH